MYICIYREHLYFCMINSLFRLGIFNSNFEITRGYDGRCINLADMNQETPRAGAPVGMQMERG